MKTDYICLHNDNTSIASSVWSEASSPDSTAALIRNSTLLLPEVEVTPTQFVLEHAWEGTSITVHCTK